MVADERQEAARCGMNATEAYLYSLYLRCGIDAGSIVVTTKSHPVGCYRLDQIDLATQAIQSQPDTYIKVNLMDAEAMKARLAEKRQENRFAQVVGTANEVKTIVSLHLDVDADKPGYLDRDTTLRRLDEMPVKPSMIINSNSFYGGFHAYWFLANPYKIACEDDREFIKTIALRWQARLRTLLDGKLDSTANIDRVLRAVGSRRSNGNNVNIHRMLPECRYTLRELSLPADDAELKKDSCSVVRKLITKTLGPCKDSDEPITEYIRASSITVADLLLEAGYTSLRGDEWRRPNSESGSRSLKIATKLDKPGINMFSGGDPNFGCHQKDGSVGQFYPIEAVFVNLRYDGDWKAAAKWCREQISARLCKEVDQRRIPVCQ